MTTALIGMEGAVATRARVALVSQRMWGDLATAITRCGHDSQHCPSWSAFATAASEAPFDLVLCDQGSEVPSDLPVPVLPVGDGMLVDEPALGALLALANLLQAKSKRCAEMEAVLAGIRTGTALVGQTPVMRRLQSALTRAADCDATVLIEGPTGSGKSLAARIVHLKSRRCGAALVMAECATLTPEQLGQLLAEAARSTLLLEDVDRLPAATQSQLVRHLKERLPAHSAGTARLIATTATHLPELVARGAFREDLFYRLHAFPIAVPALRERVEDISALVDAILDAGVPASGIPHRGITPAARMLLESMPWPGNVTQLESIVRRAQVLAAGGPIDRHHVLAPAVAQPPELASRAASAPVGEDEVVTEDQIRSFEHEEQLLLGRALRATKGNVRRAAQLLGIGRATLYRKIQQYRLRLH